MYDAIADGKNRFIIQNFESKEFTLPLLGVFWSPLFRFEKKNNNNIHIPHRLWGGSKQSKSKKSKNQKKKAKQKTKNETTQQLNNNNNNNNTLNFARDENVQKIHASSIYFF